MQFLSCVHHQPELHLRLSPRPRSSRTICWCCQPKSSHCHGNCIPCPGHANNTWEKASPQQQPPDEGRREAPVTARAGNRNSSSGGSEKLKSHGCKGGKKKKRKTANSPASSIYRNMVLTAVCGLLQPQSGKGEEKIAIDRTD